MTDDVSVPASSYSRNTTRPVLRGLLVIGSLVVMVGLGEAALRVWYRDAGRRTLGGPGGRSFDHLTIDGELRGRRDVGPKTPGVPRLMVIGDSITYGLGLHDWRQTWPELLVGALEQRGRPHQLAVFAVPGQDIRQHLDAMREWDTRVAPDVFIYQWYVNDIEAMSHRPDLTRAWQRSGWHATLRRSSYLYFMVDHRLAQWLPPPTRSYVDYLLTDFAPGTMEWAEFERLFHELATRAALASSRRLLVLYPQVPYRGSYPLQPLHDRMRRLAAPHELDIPPPAWIRAGGSLVADTAAPWKQAFTAAAQSGGAIETPEYAFATGPLTIVLVAKRVDTDPTTATIAMVGLIDAATGALIAEAPLDVAAPGGWQSVSVPFTLAGEGLQRVRVRVRSSGRAGWALADMRVPVDYGFDVVDLAEPLNTIPTHSSAFDAHPNAAAHRLIADQIYKALSAPSTAAPGGQ